MNILSIQSWVSYGHVGNASAVFPLQRMGIEVWAINTVQFSNHTGYGAWKGQVFTGDTVRELLDGMDDRGALARCNGLLTGYMGDAGIGEAILDAAARVRAHSPDVVYLCDPVLGDVGRGLFVRPGIPEFMRDRVIPAADIVTPNHFELEFLAGMEIRDITALRAATARIHALGPKVLMVTSLVLDETPDDAVDIVVSADGVLWRVRTPKLALSINGAGDAIAALFLGKYLQTRSPEQALVHAASAVFGLLTMTLAAGSREILTVQAQEEFVSPSRIFEATKLA